MIALQIVDLKDFMSKLLIGSTFDSFWLCEASVTTFATFTIDGTLHTDFYDTQEAQLLQTQSRLIRSGGILNPFAFP
ncbi:MAG: DUF5721 family protein [Blautia hansenii]